MRLAAGFFALFALTGAAPVAAQQVANQYPPSWPQPSHRPIVLRADTLLDGQGGVVHHAVIVVQDGKIVRIGGAIPKEAQVYDLGAATLTPGLIDTHDHITYHFRNGRFVDNRLVGQDEPPVESVLYAAENGTRILDAGFTTIQSPGPGTAWDIALREAYARNVLPGPRMLTSLEWFRFDLPGQTVPSEAELRRMVRDRKARGADFIKVFASTSSREGSRPVFNQSQMNAICDEARKQGLRTLVHAFTVSVKIAVDAHCTTIEHGSNGMTNEVMQAMARQGTYYDPTLAMSNPNYLANKDKFIGIGNYTEEAFVGIAKSANNTAPPAEFMRALKVPGLKIVFGTDAVAGAHGYNAESLIFRIQRGGQDPMAALTSATSLAAQSLGLDKQIGTLAPGMDADIIAMAGDYRADPAGALRHIRLVMKGGRVFRYRP